MRKYFFIVIGLFIFMLSSCRATRQVVQQSTTDSTTVTIREVKKTVHIPGDSVKTTMQVQISRDVRDNWDTSEVSFVPQIQQLETKRTKVTVELTKTGEIKATAISKELVETVTVQEKTSSTFKSSATVVEQKESWLKSFLKGVKKSFNTILAVALIAVFIYVFIRFKGRILNIIK